MTSFKGQGSFTAQIDAIILKNKTACDLLIRQSVNDVIDDAQTPRAKGGSMPVDTGFLRNTGDLGLNGIPSGPDRPAADAEPGSYEWNDGKVVATLAGAEAGDTLFWSWSAIYANRMNNMYGFLDKAVQKWPQIVAKRCREILNK